MKLQNLMLQRNPNPGLLGFMKRNYMLLQSTCYFHTFDYQVALSLLFCVTVNSSNMVWE